MNRRNRTRAGLKNCLRLHAGLVCRFTAGKDAVPCVPGFRLHAGLICRFTRPSDSSPSPLPKGRGPGVRGSFAIFGVARCPAHGVLCLFAFCFLTSPAFAQEKISYQDHILPLVEANCSKCHNADKKKADLELTSYQGALKGSGSGAILVSGNPEASKLWKALTHAEEPFMPPNRPKLADQELESFRKWILGGLLENAGGKPVPASALAMDLTLKADISGQPEGPPPMPAELPLEPVVHTARMDAITGLASSPWAPLIAVAGQKQVLLFHSDTLDLLGILPFTEGQPVEVTFSRSGRLLLASGGRGAKSGRVVVWDILTGARLMTLGGEYDAVLTADIRADQSQVALGGPSRLVKIFSTKTGELQHKIKKHTDWVTAVAFSPNGQLLATADRNGGISLWDPDSAQELFTLAGHKSAVTALSWRSDSKLLVSSSEDGAVKLWETQEGKQAKSWTAHGAGVLSVSYSHDGHLVTCGRDNTVILWDANGSKVRSLDSPGDLPLRATFSPDGKRIFLADFSGRVTVWRANDGKQSGELNPNPLPLADQLAAAQKRVSQLEAAQAKVAKTEAENPNGALAEAKAAVTRLEAARLLSSVYLAREKLAAGKCEQQRAVAVIEADRRPTGDTEKIVSPAKRSTAKADSQTNAAPGGAGKDRPGAKQLAAEIKAQQSQLDQLLAQYHSLISAAQGIPHPSGR